MVLFIFWLARNSIVCSSIPVDWPEPPAVPPPPAAVAFIDVKSIMRYGLQLNHTEITRTMKASLETSQFWTVLFRLFRLLPDIIENHLLFKYFSN